MGENTFKHPHFIDHYTMFETLIKINFVDNCKIYASFFTHPIFWVVSVQKEQKLWSSVFLFFVFVFVSYISLASCGQLSFPVLNTKLNIYRNLRNG